MKQTAVDWLADNLHYLHSTKWDDILQQAKEMEKQQMIDFAMDYVNSDSIGCLWDGDSAPELDIDTSAEQYYYRTFNINDRHN
jgi:hypothetical protein